MGFVLSQADRFAVRANLRQVPIPDSVGFSVQRRPPVVEQNVASVVQGDDLMTHAVRKGDVLDQTQAVQIIVLQALEMGKNVDIRQAKSRDPPLKQRVDGGLCVINTSFKSDAGRPFFT